ncbi:MAG TPA: methyltransferase domain-containing protein [Vicinamibacterales bacterium]|jgi:ubiquinone/menaquinone biosynthesis C-methylase UbiE|nr:methyltransferase domain-containing protein [Vicinamibacterales bacterium]
MPDATYTHGHHESVLRSHRWRTVENSAAYLIPHLRAGLRLLDVGCGPGTITADFARRVGSGNVLGIDVSADVIAKARLDYSDVWFAIGDVYRIDEPDASYDIVHAHQVLQHLADPVAAFKEMRRVVRPGGLVAVRESDYGSFTWHPADDRLVRWLDLYRAIARSNRGEPDAGRHLLSWAQQAGFSRITSSASAWCFATPEERAWWGGLWADRMTQSAISRQAVRDGRATAEELAGLADAWREWATREDGWFAVLHGEVIGER